MIFIKNGDAWVETADADIPPAILAALKEDGTHKNLKIHFPNGEIPDFDNSFIVRESLRFTESICSQDTFKFGLAEASVLEFETVGVGNMRGMMIEANLFYGPAADPVAYVPLGVFTVESCPRDAGVLMRRKVRAYTNSGAGIVQNNPVELTKLATRSQGTAAYTPDLFYLITAAVGWNSPAYMAQFSKTPYQIPAPTPPRPGSRYRTMLPSSQYPGKMVIVEVTAALYQLTFSAGNIPPNALYCLERADTTPALNDAGDWLVGVLPQWADGPYDTLVYEVKRALLAQAAGYRFSAGLPVFYPGGGAGLLVSIPYSATITVTRPTAGGGTATTTYNVGITPNASLYTWDIPASGVTGSFPPTATINLSGTDFSTYVDAYDLGAIAEGYFEAQGQFCRMARSGGIEVITLSADNPLTVLPGEYSSCWWTEDGPQRIGTVRVRYMAGDEEQVVDISIGDGAGLYDMTDNGYFSAVDGIDYATIEAFIQEHFAPAVEGLALTEIDLDMRALPHVQAGQALSVVAEDGEIVNTCMLRREMSGIQQLSDAITCPPPGVKEA